VDSQQEIVIFGASVRAAAFSALRAGLCPWCADLFADEDFRSRCSTYRIPSHSYPDGFEFISQNAPPGPWMYTGGIENHSSLVKRISKFRALWGNNSDALGLARSPTFLAEMFQSNGICFPKTFTSITKLPDMSRWLAKPFQSAGGAGIRWVVDSDKWSMARKDNRVLRLPRTTNHLPLTATHHYFQEFIEGIPCSAVYVGLEKSARFLGATRQLVGETWLNAAPFHYCGSVGPLKLDSAVQNKLENIGDVLNRECHLRGLFGVDFILSDEIPWPVEVNPRYPASVEILEHAGIQAMALHRSAFDPTSLQTSELSSTSDMSGPLVGKAILFTVRPLKFPKEGPWTRSLTTSRSIHEIPDFADIPSAGSAIKAGRPILTLFSHSDSLQGCIENLKQIALDLDPRFRMK
jgi:predicted ATP-grasp superfamily ATP-dependent carboligase